MVDTLSSSKVAYARRGNPFSSGGESVPPTGLPARFLEAFFSRPFVVSAPLILLTGLGVYSLSDSNDDYRAFGVISVSNTSLLANLTEVGTDQGFSFETPAAVTSRAINDLLSTDEFTQDVAERAGLEPGALSDAELLDAVRSSVGAGATGTNLVAVSATTKDPDRSSRLAEAAIASFTEWVVEADVSQSTTAELFFGDLIAEYEAEVESARSALETFLVDNPLDGGASSFATRQQSAISRLESDVDLAEERYITAVTDQQSAQLATQQARIDIEQRLRLVDMPDEAELLTKSSRDQALTLAMYVIAGLLLSLGLVALRAFLDRAVHSADDIRAATGFEVLAVVPEVRR